MIGTRRALHPVSTDILESLYQHRVLTTKQIHAMHGGEWNERSIRQLLSAGPTPKQRDRGQSGDGLEERGLVAHVQHRGADHRGALAVWHLTLAGAEYVEAGGRNKVERRLVTTEQAAGVLQLHTLAVNEVGLAFVRAAKERGDEFGPLSWRHEVGHLLAPLDPKRRSEWLNTDAVLSYLRLDPLVSEHRFLEVDRGTEPPQQLAEQLQRYARLKSFESDRRDRRYSIFPRVIVALAGYGRETRQRRMEVVSALTLAGWDELPVEEQPSISFVLLEDLVEMGPYEAIFYPLSDLHRLVDWLGQE